MIDCIKKYAGIDFDQVETDEEAKALAKEHHIEYVDNRKQSNIIWVIYDKDNKVFVESTISKLKLKASLERRGAIATGNRPAWRVMI